MDTGALTAHVQRTWDDDVLPSLEAYIAIPALSPAFDADWVASGHIEHATEHIRAWCAARAVEGMTVTVHRLEGRTPVIICDIAAFGGAATDDTVLLYGHLDKQPPMDGWVDGLGPWTPVRRGPRLYGRGGADDGYSAYCALTAIEGLQRAGGQHVRCIVLIEASEESGSPDLPTYIEHFAAEGMLPDPSLVVCLDSGAGDYERLWLTTSLRGLVGMTITVEVLVDGVHSGSAGGVVPSSFRILRELLDRIEDSTTGRVLLPELHAEVPADRAAEMESSAPVMGEEAGGVFPWLSGVRKQAGDDPVELLAARTWAPSIAYVGMDGMPPTAIAGNVLRARTTLGLAVRLPPTVDGHVAAAALEQALTADPPSGAHVTVEIHAVGDGWNAAPFEPWLQEASAAASQAAFGEPWCTLGEGGSIPFMAMLGLRYPAAQFAVTGALGPENGAHGPNEFLHVPAATAVTQCVAHILDAHARR